MTKNNKNYHQVRINESGLNTNGTLGDSHFADTSYPSVSLTKRRYNE